MFDTAAPESWISEIPALLGFGPQSSLILLTIAGGSLGTVMRVDLDAHPAEVSGRLAAVAAVAADHDVDSAIVVIVDLHSGDHTDLVDALTAALTVRGIRVLGALGVDDISAGGRWHCLDGCGAGGILEDPAASVMAAAAVLDGRKLYRNRGEVRWSLSSHKSPRRSRWCEPLWQPVARRQSLARPSNRSSPSRAPSRRAGRRGLMRWPLPQRLCSTSRSATCSWRSP